MLGLFRQKAGRVFVYLLGDTCRVMTARVLNCVYDGRMWVKEFGVYVVKKVLERVMISGCNWNWGWKGNTESNNKTRSSC